MSLALEFLLPTALGLLLTLLVAPMMLASSIAGDFGLRIFLAAPAGIAVASIIHLLLLQVNGARSGVLLLVELVLLVAGALWLINRKRLAAPRIHQPVFSPVEWPALSALLGIAVLFALWHALAGLHATSMATPHGEWDAWAVWNMRARFLNTENWRDAWAVTYAHVDYPLLMPNWIAYGWTRLGNETTAFPAATAGVFTFATVGLLTVSVSVLRGMTHGLLAGLFLLACTRFTYIGTIQYADVPFAFFFLATLVALALQDRFDELHPRLLALAGVFAGMAAWTKNEGQAMMFAVLLSLFAICVLQRGAKKAAAAVGWFLAGAAPFIALIIGLRIALRGGGNWLQTQSSMTLSERLVDVPRYKLIAKAFWNESKDFAGFSGGMARFIMLFYALIVGIRVRRDKLFPWLGMAALAIVIAIVFAVYVVTPFDVQWHLATSISRIVCQWLPSGLFVYFLLLDTPEELQRAESDMVAK